MSFLDEQKQLNQDIADGKFKKAYLLYGQQGYLKNQNRDKLLHAFLGEDETAQMNLYRVRGKEFNVLEAIDLGQTLPFLSEHRVLLFENTSLFDRKEEGGALAKVFDSFPETTRLIISEEKIDKRAALYKAIQADGFVLECDKVDEKLLLSWSAKLFQDAKVRIDRSVLHQFLEAVGDDMFRIRSEAEKLITFHAGEEDPVVTSEDIETFCTAMLDERIIFQMIEQVLRGNRKRALAMYRDLLALQTTPQAILSLLQRQFQQLLHLSEIDGSAQDSVLAERIGTRDFVIRKNLRPLLREFGKEDLIAALSACAEADRAYKSGKMDARIAVEEILVTAGGSL